MAAGSKFLASSILDPPGFGAEGRIRRMFVALVVLATALQDPATLEEWMARGRERFVNGYREESAAAWSKVIEKDPTKIEGYLGRARARRMLGDATGAGD